MKVVQCYELFGGIALVYHASLIYMNGLSSTVYSFKSRCFIINSIAAEIKFCEFIVEFYGCKMV